MSGPIAFRFTDDDLREEFDEYRKNHPDDPKNSEAARELIDAGLSARHRDVYDNIGADEELRDRVAALRNVEETDEKVVRRLLRVGVQNAGDDGPTSARVRLLHGLGGVAVAALPAIAAVGGALVGGVLGAVALAVVAVVVWGVVFAYADALAAAIGNFQSWAVDVLDEEAARNTRR